MWDCNFCLKSMGRRSYYTLFSSLLGPDGEFCG